MPAVSLDCECRVEAVCVGNPGSLPVQGLHGPMLGCRLWVAGSEQPPCHPSLYPDFEAPRTALFCCLEIGLCLSNCQLFLARCSLAGHLLAYCPLQVCVIQGSELKGLEGQPHGEWLTRSSREGGG